MIKVKKGADVSDLKRELWQAIHTIDPIFKKFGSDTTITSGCESVPGHSRKSLHYLGCAVDLRTRDIKTEDEKWRVVVAIREKLGDYFDVIYEAAPEHIHLEYDPRERMSRGVDK